MNCKSNGVTVNNPYHCNNEKNNFARNVETASSLLPTKILRSYLSPTAIHLISGAVAGGFSKTITAPLDRLKLLLQIAHLQTKPLTSLGTFKTILREEGISGLYRGNGTNCIKAIPETALKFVAYDWFKRRIIRTNHERELNALGNDVKISHQMETESAVPLSLQERIIAGACAGAVAQVCVYPLEVVKTRLATAKLGIFLGIKHCIKNTIQKEGTQALSQGFIPSMLGILPYAGLDLACFETLKEKCKKIKWPYLTGGIHADDELPSYVVLVCGGASSAFGQTIAYPLGMYDVLYQTIHIEGYKALYRGLLPNLAKAVPAVSITWVIYELTKRHLNQFTQD